MEHVAFDRYKRYTFVSIEDTAGQILQKARIEHQRGSVCTFLERRKQGSLVAIETVGNWYWIVDEIEKAGMVPKLVNARKAKRMARETRLIAWTAMG